MRAQTRPAARWSSRSGPLRTSRDVRGAGDDVAGPHHRRQRSGAGGTGKPREGAPLGMGRCWPMGALAVPARSGWDGTWSGLDPGKRSGGRAGGCPRNRGMACRGGGGRGPIRLFALRRPGGPAGLVRKDVAHDTRCVGPLPSALVWSFTGRRTPRRLGPAPLDVAGFGDQPAGSPRSKRGALRGRRCATDSGELGQPGRGRGRAARGSSPSAAVPDRPSARAQARTACRCSRRDAERRLRR